jgi:esterase/lipase superfamily enzyme
MGQGRQPVKQWLGNQIIFCWRNEIEPPGLSLYKSHLISGLSMKPLWNITASLLVTAVAMITSLPISAAVSNRQTAEDTVTKSTDRPTTKQEWLVVPVFYATNRAFVGENGNINYSEEPNGGGLLFGVKNIAASVPTHSPVDKETETKMSWQRLNVTEAKPIEPATAPVPPPDVDGSKCSVKNQTLTRDEIIPAFSSYMQKSGNHETVIFVHGCCATFDRSMQRAATVAAHMQVPVLLYDWVSPKGFKKYLENETRAEQTMDDFCRFFAKVEKIIEPGNVTLMGHSMGTRFVDQSMVRRSQRALDQAALPKFKELILSNADNDAKSFLNHAKEFAGNAERSRIYFNNADDVLDASAIAHGGFSRLGNPGALLSDLSKTEGMEFVDITANNSKHEVPFWIVANLHRYNNLGPVKEFQLKQLSPGLVTVQRTELSKEEPAQTIPQCACNR